MLEVQCGKCKTARYCSLDWQKKDWEKHKQMCKQMQQHAVGDDAAQAINYATFP